MTETKTYTIAKAILVELPDGSTKDLQEVLSDILNRLDNVEHTADQAHNDMHDLSGDLSDLLSNLRDV